jgi:dipeptidyl aminopeptidase/acylaminoacyl peptidase
VTPAHSGAVVFRHKGLKLVGVLARPAGPERKRFPGVLFLHGFPGSEQNVDIRRLLMKRGAASLAVHFSGAWGSEGCYSFSGLVPQAQTALKFLAAQTFVDPRRLAVFGFSMGGWAALNLAARVPSLRAVAAVAPVGGPEMIGSRLREHVAHLSRALRIRSVGALAKDFVRAVTEDDPAKAAARLACPLLLVHGSKDDVVPPAVSQRLLSAAIMPKTLVIAKGARHDFLDRRDWLSQLVAGWLLKRLSSTPAAGSS